jgi:hypothetical protein
MKVKPRTPLLKRVNKADSRVCQGRIFIKSNLVTARQQGKMTPGERGLGKNGAKAVGLLANEMTVPETSGELLTQGTAAWREIQQIAA